jgi:D-alanyl-D-alanine carboxypeptidase
MRRCVTCPWLLWLTVLVWALPAAAQSSLPPAVQQLLRQVNVPSDALAAVAIPLGTPSLLLRPWRHRDQVAMQPASTMKLVTSIVALDAAPLRCKTACCKVTWCWWAALTPTWVCRSSGPC